jgi:hypothetical protein
VKPQVPLWLHPKVALTDHREDGGLHDGVGGKVVKLHLVVVEERAHEDRRWHTKPPLVEAHHSGCDRLVLGRSSPSSTNSSNLLSITEEVAQSSAGRIWLFPAIGAVRRGVDGEDAVAAAMRAESAIRQGLSEAEDCRSARDRWGT